MEGQLGETVWSINCINDKNIPKPREATSVAIRMGALPVRNSANKTLGGM